MLVVIWELKSRAHENGHHFMHSAPSVALGKQIILYRFKIENLSLNNACSFKTPSNVEL